MPWEPKPLRWSNDGCLSNLHCKTPEGWFGIRSEMNGYDEEKKQYKHYYVVTGRDSTPVSGWKDFTTHKTVQEALNWIYAEYERQVQRWLDKWINQ